MDLAESHYLMVICVCSLLFTAAAFAADLMRIKFQYHDLWPLTEFALEVTFMTLSFFASVTMASACRWTYNDDESFCDHYMGGSARGYFSALFGFLLSLFLLGSVNISFQDVRKYEHS